MITLITISIVCTILIVLALRFNMFGFLIGLFILFSAIFVLAYLLSLSVASGYLPVVIVVILMFLL